MTGNHSYSVFKAILSLVICWTIVFCLSSCRGPSEKEAATVLTETSAADAKRPVVQTSAASVDDIDAYGDLLLELTSGELKALGFEYADMVTVRISDRELLMPIVPEYRYVSAGSLAVVMWKDPEKPVELEVYNGSFVSDCGIAKQKVAADGAKAYTVTDGVSFPLSVTIEMNEKGGYADTYAVYDLKRSPDRKDYPGLSDEEFCNFRMVTTSGVGKDKLYRSSSPIFSSDERCLYADAACAAHGIRSIVNLSDTAETASAYNGYPDTYYSKQKILFLEMNVDFETDVNRAGIVEMMDFIANAETPVLIHCVWGQDRSAFVCALLECLMGASYREIQQDYMLSYYNYYGVMPGTKQYDTVAKNLDEHLNAAFGTKDLAACDLKKEVEEYFRELGVGDDIVEAVRQKIGG